MSDSHALYPQSHAFESMVYRKPRWNYYTDTEGTQRTLPEQASLAEQITFSVNGNNCGIRCNDALNGTFPELAGRNDPMFQGSTETDKITLHLLVRCITFFLFDSSFLPTAH